METVRFLFVIHNHQPVGNFEHVFAEAWRDCYAPFLRVLRGHPSIRCTLHFTGPLLEWMERREPRALDGIGELVAAGRVEILGGGFYEPILPSIPPEDALGQLRLMSDWLRERFGAAPTGLWLAERVWEPHLPSLIAAAGLRYTLLDDSHFLHAGLAPGELHGHYVTENAGATLAVFPIDRRLRYLIPFDRPEAAIDYLRDVADRSPGRGVTVGDDGEKFGLWPGTHKWVYEEGYLDRLFRMIEENGEWLSTLTLREYVDRFPPRGRIYLPAASYDEMMEWALPAEARARLEEAVDRLKREDRHDEIAPFIRSGFWRNFLVKYPESNLQRCKALHVGRMVRARIPGDAEALRAVWRSQCNCAYWHGLFGGLYLNSLRHENYRNALEAEAAADGAVHGDAEWVEAERTDYDCDGRDEILLRSGRVNAFIWPGYGGSLFELDYKPRRFNLSDTLTRHLEPYHARLRREGSPGPALHHDWYLRRSFLDHLFGPNTTLEDFERCGYPEQGGFVNQPYEAGEPAVGEGAATVSLRRRGVYHAPRGRALLEIEKTYALRSSGDLAVAYVVSNPPGEAEVDVWLGIEINLTLLSCDGRERYLRVLPAGGRGRKAAGTGAAERITAAEFVNRPSGFLTRVSWDMEAGLWHFPLRTVSQSEKGFDLTYQGTAVVPHFRFTLPPRGERRLAFHIEIVDL
ncbi:MAG: DUF1926 domain-containing protein [bacterium]|nr:DUF1926 domain-containing protein [bacterium]